MSRWSMRRKSCTLVLACIAANTGWWRCGAPAVGSQHLFPRNHFPATPFRSDCPTYFRGRAYVVVRMQHTEVRR